jgi:DNA polymerase-3 subunit alpha
MNMNNYTLFHAHSTFSMLDGFGTPKANAKRAKELGMSALGLSDHGNIFGHIQHLDACKREGIKPILGVELYCYHQPLWIRQGNRWNSHMVIWAKNKAGWQDLMSLVNWSHSSDCFYYRPRVYLETKENEGKEWRGVDAFTKGNVMGFSGHQGSHLSDVLFCDLYAEDEDSIKQAKETLKLAYNASRKDIDSKKILRPDWHDAACKQALKMEGIFGKGNFFVELQNELNPNDKLALWIHPLIVECLRQVSKDTGVPSLASGDPHYPTKEDAKDQRILVMANLKTTEQEVAAALQSEEGVDTMVFFGSDEFYIKSYDEMNAKFTKEELERTNRVAAQIEEYALQHEPIVPQIELPEFDDDKKILPQYTEKNARFLIHLCLEGAKRREPWNEVIWQSRPKNERKTRKDYWDRLQQELETIIQFGVTGYFLVVWDLCMAADYRPADMSFDWRRVFSGEIKGDPVPRGDGRGSAAGCLVSYLIGITGSNIDPLYYSLSFARFLNKGRLTGDHVHLADIDLDFAVEDREWIINYLKWRYGVDSVAQIVTFNRMQGRAAIKDVMRVKGIENGFELGNEICKNVPDEASISDEIQAMRDSGQPSYGILSWAIDNSAGLQEHYSDPLIKPIIDQALRCEGVMKNQGKHASGVVVVPGNISSWFPMVYDAKSKTQIVAVDMKEVERLGGVKLDILGTAVLDKLQMAQDLVNGHTTRRGRVEHEEQNDED